MWWDKQHWLAVGGANAQRHKIMHQKQRETWMWTMHRLKYKKKLWPCKYFIKRQFSLKTLSELKDALNVFWWVTLHRSKANVCKYMLTVQSYDWMVKTFYHNEYWASFNSLEILNRMLLDTSWSCLTDNQMTLPDLCHPLAPMKCPFYLVLKLNQATLL